MPKTMPKSKKSAKAKGPKKVGRPTKAAKPKAGKSRKVSPIPAGFSTVTAGLTCKDARKEIEFLERALGAKTNHIMADPESGRVVHADIEIGTSHLFLNDPMPGCGATPGADGSPASFYLYVKDCDALFARAVKAGGKVQCEPMDMFWGDRMGVFTCPEGYGWTVATHIADPTPAEMAEGQKKFMEMMKSGGAPT